MNGSISDGGVNVENGALRRLRWGRCGPPPRRDVRCTGVDCEWTMRDARPGELAALCPLCGSPIACGPMRFVGAYRLSQAEVGLWARHLEATRLQSR